MLGPSLTPVRTPIGEAWILAEDEAAIRDRTDGLAGPVRLLPSGDPYLVLQGADRELVVSDAGRAANCGRRGSGQAGCSSAER